MTQEISSSSTKEEVADYFQKEFKISEEVKNKLIEEDISGDILLDISIQEYKSFGIKPGSLVKIKNFLSKNEEKLKQQNEIKEKITIKSNAEEVKSFLERCLNFTKETNNLDGKGLIELDADGMTNLGLNFGQKLKIVKYINYFKTLKVEEEPINEDITINENSSDEEVQKFLLLKCKITKEVVENLGIDAQSLFMFEDTDIDEMTELNEEQKELFKKNLNELKLKQTNQEEETRQKEPEPEPEPEIVINENSTEEEVAKFLKIKLNFSDKSINELQLDGQSLSLLNPEDVDDFEITEDEKSSLREYLKEKKEKQSKEPEKEKETEIKINFESSKEEVEKFLKKKLNLKEEIINELDLDGEILFLLDENDIKEIDELDKNEKELFIKTLKEINIRLTEKSSKKEVAEFLKNNLDFNESAIENIDLDGNEFLSLKEEDIDKIENISEEKKNKIKNYLNMMNIIITENSNKREVAIFLKIKLLFSFKSIKKLDINGENLFSLEEKEINENKKIKQEEKEKLKHFLKSRKSLEINQEHKYNAFFILMVKEKYKKYLKIQTYEESGVIRKKLDYFNCKVIHEADYLSKKDEPVKLNIYHVYSDKNINELTIAVHDKFFDSNLKASINPYYKEIYFYTETLFFDDKNDFFDIPTNIFIREYLSCFFDEKKEINQKFKSSLLKALLDMIYKYENIELYPNEMLSFFKYCCEQKIKPENIESLELKKYKNKEDNDKNILNKNYYITDSDIDNLNMKLRKTKFLYLLSEIYSIYDTEHLLKLMKSKYEKDFSASILDLLINNRIKFKDLTFKNDKEITNFQKYLLSASSKKEEVNFTIKLSEGLYENLIFIKENFKIITKILEDNAKIFRWKITNYQLSLERPDEKDDIDKIIIALSEIMNLSRDKNYKILNYEEIFEDLLNAFSNRDLDQLCKLHNLIELLKNERINQKIVENFYNKIHEKGLFLIQKKGLETSAIIKFLSSQDIYYYSPKFKNSNNRDSEIFKYICITDEDKNYLDNIKLVKENKLWNIFSDNKKMQTKFYEIIIDQVKKVRDFKSLFDIFPIKSIDREFTLLINGKFQDIILTALDDKFEVLFEIFDNWLIINDYNKLDLGWVTEKLEINYDLTSKYFFYLLKNKNMNLITEKIKNLIINFFLKQNKEGVNNAESLISLLLIAPNNNFLLFFLNQLNNQIMTEKDFYQKEETKSFVLFKLFFEKCNDLLKNNAIAGGVYLLQTVLIKNKIFNDLQNCDVQYNIINSLMEEGENDKIFYKKIQIITENKAEADKIYKKLKDNLNICNKKFEELRMIEDFYTSFYSLTKENIIELVKKKTLELKNKNISEIIKIDNIFEGNKDFNFEEVKNECKNIKYKNSCFFMTIYIKNKDNQGIFSEDKIYKDTVDNFKETLTKIIQQKDTKEPFFEINNIEQIMKATKNPQNDLHKEIEFIEKEFENLGKNEYIKNDLLNDLNNFSKKDKIKNILQGISELIESYKDLSGIQLTEFTNNLKSIIEAIKSKGVSGEDIKKSKDFLLKYNYNVDKESLLLDFYELFVDQKKSVQFLKTIKDKNFDIRYLNEFIDESESIDLQTSDIDNLNNINMFFSKFVQNKEIKTDENFFVAFKKEFENEKDIAIKLNGYLKSYGEIIQLYQSYNENPEMTIEKLNNVLKDSLVTLKKDIKLNSFIFSIKYKKQGNQESVANLNELDELRNKILLSSSNANLIQNENEQDQQILDKAKLTKDFVNLIDSIKQLNQTLNSLLKSGYFHIKDISLKIKDGKATEKEGNKNLQKIIEEYNEINEKFKNDIKEAYIKYPYLRLFYGQQFIQLYEKTKNKDINISSLINSVTMNNINNPKINFDFNENINELENINLYLDKLFNEYKINIKNIYNKNKVFPELNIKPGLYRKTKVGDNNDLIDNILTIYQNLTGNIPIINTLLLCNEDTSIEKIEAFLNRALLYEEPALFVLSNMECLELSTKTELTNKLKTIYEYKKNKINSIVLFLYEKVDSGLVRDLEKLIPERNIFNNIFLKKPEKKNEELAKIDLYSSIYSGYGKTTEIKYKVKNNKGEYKYLPIGGCFNRDYVINNLNNLKLNFQNAKNIYLHLDLSETDNDDLMNEILFKLVILRFLDSNENLFYLGHDIHIIIEIPKGFVEFDKKYKLLNLFNKIYIDKLCPLRLKEDAKMIGESEIAIVAEVLTYYSSNQIGKKNIDLNAPITKTAKECEQIIDKYFNVENQSYYQKINFIKILAIQFKKFTENPFFNYELLSQDGKGPVIEKARISVISNFISLTKVFTRSPFDGVLLSQNKSMEIFGKYNEEQAVEEGIMKLANEDEKQEIFSFDKIKPSLVFFNMDGGSLSIITNNDRNDQEYKNLRLLWNSQNRNENESRELIDYKNMNHDKFLEQIKILFSLNKMEVPDIKKLCENLGNYIFVADNFIKMVRILLNIEAKIPVILMGETGVGKTKLLEMLATLYGQGVLNWHRLQIHAGTTDKKIVEFIEEVMEKEKGKDPNQKVWIFLDEINTCNSLGLITEIMCNHTYLGKPIDERFVFLGACNPYRVINKKMRESGLVYYNLKEKNKLNNLVYTVNPLPHSLLNFIFDFGSLRPQDEKKYIQNTVISILSKFKGKIVNDINDNELENIKNETIECISICHDYIREIYDKSSVSMREIRRFGIFFEYFIKYFKGKGYDRMKWSLNMTIYLCYYLRINDKKCRTELVNKLNKFYKVSFLKVPEYETRKITREMIIEEGKGIALNRALRENLFTTFVCIENTVPIIIIGKPGTGKSLSFQILFNTLKGENSESVMFRNRGKLYRYYYQGSETSTAEGIEQVFAKALNAKKKDPNSNNINLVFFDEMGLAERSLNNPLKVIHFLLEKDEKDSVPFLGISNWRLDAAKINRALNLSITDYDPKDLEETAISIAEALDMDLSNKYKDFFETLAKTYYEYLLFNKNTIKENKDFHGNRDFYNLIKTAMRELIAKKEELNRNENKTLTEIGLLSLSRNFGGLENSDAIVRDIFKKLYADKFDENVEISKGFSVLEAIKKNVSDRNSRYLMLISEGSDASDITKFLLESLGKKYIELVGTKYTKDLGRYSEEILNKIKYIMETDNVLILRNLDMIYPSLYDLFNQNFTIMGDKRYARIAFEYAKISSEVNKDFHVVVIVNNDQVQNLKLDPPFLNRFEKHIVNFNMLLEEKDIAIAKNISDYFNLIATFNKNQKLKIDLEKLLINCKKHHIEGLIFKIKNDLLKKNENKEKNKDEKDEDNWINKEGSEYEEKMNKEILKKIVPTFCQDIIASILILEKKLKKYDKLKKIILDIYQKSNHSNFASFFKKLQSRKNVIYTFSKVLGNLFENEEEIENKFGKFISQNILTGMIESIKSENDLIFLLKSFTNINKKILILQFTERHVDKINSINYVINNFHKEIQNLDDKIIIFIIHKQRMRKIKKKKIIPDYIPFFDDNFYQIFIDNLQGKENLNILKVMQKKNQDLAKEYIESSDFIEKKIFTILNYLKYTVLYETKDLNMRNFTSEFTEKIIDSKFIKQLLTNNIKLQGKSIKGIIDDVFTSDVMEVNDVDFFEVINSKLGSFFCNYLLKIIYFSLKDCVLNTLLFNKHLDLIINNEYFQKFISEYFEKTEFVGTAPKMNINANELNIYNGLEIPKSRGSFDLLVKYISGSVALRYLNIEKKMRKIYKEEEANELEKTKEEYNNKLERYQENIRVEINKIETLKVIFNQNDENIKKILFEDYFIYFICKYLEKKNIKYEYNPKLLSFLKLIIKIKLSDLGNGQYEFNYSQEEFIKILLFTQGYKLDIKSILDIFVELQKHCDNLEELIIKILEKNEIKYEISYRSQRHSKTVNLCFFNIVESLIRAILIQSVILTKNKIKFFEFIYSLTSIEANLQKINKKFYLYSKEIYNIRNLIKIQEAFKGNYESFFKNYETILDNIMEQSILFYENNYNNLFNKIIELIKLLDNLFKDKNEDYINLMFFIYRHQYRNIYVEEIRIKLVEKFFENKLLINKSKIFASEILKFLKPESQNDENVKKEELIKNFMNLDDNKFQKYKNLIKILNNINSPEFNEILLYFFEGQCQIYFQEILDKNKQEYNQKCCEQLLLNLSLEYLKKSIQYLYENKNKNENNLLKLFAIAYIKIYLYYFVEINFNKFDNINWDEINRILDDKDENNKLIREMRNLYIWRLYCKKFENFDQFENFNFEAKKITIYKELLLKMQEEKNKVKYIFNNCFITPNNLEKYSQIDLKEIKFEQYNDNFDLLYVLLVNKTISYMFGNDKKDIINKMKDIYNKSKDKLTFDNEGKTIYQYLLNNELFEKNINKKICDKGINQKEFEILLYSFRFIFNLQIKNKKCFYNNILKKNAYNFINNNFIPGSYPEKTLFSLAYYDIEKKMSKDKRGVGYYVCKDCGFNYEVPPCTFACSVGKCPYMHDIGGIDHVLTKKDIRVFYEEADYKWFTTEYCKSYGYNPWPAEWVNGFAHTTLKEFKANYVDKNLKPPKKGIVLTDLSDVEKNNPIRDIHIVSFRILHFILYSYLLGSQILGNITNQQIMNILCDGLYPQTLFNFIKKDWELLESNLNGLGFENIQTFINMIFDKLIELISKFEDASSFEKSTSFEKEINKYITEIILNKDTIKKLNKDYQGMNNKLLNSDPNSIKEIILGNYDPMIYDQNIYPDIQYYTVSNIQNYNIFVNKFKSSKENENKYFLINTLISKEDDFTQDVINMKNLKNINKLTNVLLNIYSYKISREDGKKLKLKDELDNILELYNEMNQVKIENVKDFTKEYINPFLSSWDAIKSKSVQYKCRILRDLEKGEKPFDMNIDLPLCYFLTDDGDKDGGMFLASAYQHFIGWQNSFIEAIIGNNRLSGIHNSYVSQLEQEVFVHDAGNEEIINIDKNIYKNFNEFIETTSMRNILNDNKKINYKNYNDIIYNYDFIEEELGKLILPGIKKFKKDKIKFITYLYEGFRGGNSTVLVDYNAKYLQRELSDDEKNSLNKLLENNNNIKFHNDIFASLQILMNEIIKENYEKNHLIYKIIENLPEYIILNPQLIKMFKDSFEFGNAQVFTIDSLVSIFEHFEALCWKAMKKNILPDYQLEISPPEMKKYIIEYFDKNKDQKKLINIKNFTVALRKLISRSIAGSRQEIDVKSDAALKLYIGRGDLWPTQIIENEEFINEIFFICKDEILVGNCLDLYNSLDGDAILNRELNKNENDNNNNNIINKNDEDDDDIENDDEDSDSDREGL